MSQLMEGKGENWKINVIIDIIHQIRMFLFGIYKKKMATQIYLTLEVFTLLNPDFNKQ